MRNERLVYTPFDQQLGHAAVEGVETLQDAGLDRPLVGQSLVEVPEALGIRPRLTLLRPDLYQRREFLYGQVPPVVPESGDRFPCHPVFLPGCGQLQPEVSPQVRQT